jgi:hypothetical protein
MENIEIGLIVSGNIIIFDFRSVNLLKKTFPENRLIKLKVLINWKNWKKLGQSFNIFKSLLH